jgi:serine/threonine protein kinase
MSQPINLKYRISKKVGSGAYGDVFAVFLPPSMAPVALKLEKSGSRSTLSHECRVLKLLEGVKGIPSLLHFGEAEEGLFMITELLGASLEDLLILSNRKMSLKSVLMILNQILTILESVHSKQVVHQDIKPSNFLIGLGHNKSKVHLIDFGLSKKLDLVNEESSQSSSIVGTPKFLSLSAHSRNEQSFKDDLESLAYMTVYLLTGSLPWQGVGGNCKIEKYSKIFDIKTHTSPEDLCRGLPVEFRFFVNYARSLKVEERPDYRMVKNWFSRLFQRRKFLDDQVFDWTRVLKVRKDSFALDEEKEE